MGKKWPKVIRDPVHNIVPFEDCACDRLLLELINAKELQRLRRIKQLGVSNFVFPGADHTRFSHSIGVMHIARMFLERITGPLKRDINELHSKAVLAAALLHDVGHGPFSHAFEKISGENHEKRTLEIIRDPSTEVHQILSDASSDGAPELPELLDAFFSEDPLHSTDLEESSTFCLSQIVSSQLDADRFDYLLRDSRGTGTGYGRFDLAWLLQNLFLDRKSRFYLGYKAMLAAEQYVYARYHMYRSVYFHKTTRSAEVMLQLLFQRYQELLQQATLDHDRKTIAPGTPPGILRAFSDDLSLADYLQLDDCSITEFWRSCEASNDSVLKKLGGGLLNRRLYKAIDLTHVPGARVVEFVEKAKAFLKQQGMDPEYALAHDSPADTPYKPYDPATETSAPQIFVEHEPGQIKELSRCSEMVHELTKKYTLVRYYCPAEYRDEIERIAEQVK
ncbi:MAG: HD domain-containing protein [Planctomycetota bacterium]